MAFSRFINRPRLVFKYDIDVVGYAIASALIPIIIGIFTTYLVVGIAIGLIIGYFVLKNFHKFVKVKIPGRFLHFLYDIGLIDPNKKSQNPSSKIPPGFINEFYE